MAASPSRAVTPLGRSRARQDTLSRVPIPRRSLESRGALAWNGRHLPMDLVEHYKRQFAWRDWATILAALPPLRGQTILDLGCGVGDPAALLVERGARVIGVDANEDLLSAARARGLERATFVNADLAALPDLGVAADGVWASFAAAYFVDFEPVLKSWAARIRPAGWIALVEIDDLFGHEPLSARTKERLAAYAREALAAKRYDFHMGRKLRGHLERAGLAVSNEFTVSDRELSFDGPAIPDVVAAWGRRLDSLRLLRDLCGAEFDTVRDDFLRCLENREHRSTARVVVCLATK
jgi:SAM-dependent methyltransferase